MKQYVRAYIRNGAIEHLHTQTTPINHEPLDGPVVYAKDDFTLDQPGRTEFIRADELRQSMRVTMSGRVEWRPNTPEGSRKAIQRVVRE